MATAVLGEIGAYDLADEEWPNIEDANRVTNDGKKRSVFIAVVGPNSCNLL